MAIYKNTDEKSIFASIDFDSTNNTAFFFVKSEADVEKARHILEQSGETFVAKSYVKGQTVIIAQSQELCEHTLKKISSLDTGEFVPELEQKQTSLQFIKEHGWKMRGGSSIAGQSLTLFSALRTPTGEIKDGKLLTKFDPANGAFAVLNLAANFINLVFGGQKEEDIHGLEKFDKIIADEVNHYLPTDKHNKISPADVRKLSYMSDEEFEEHNKDRSAMGLLKRNSVRLGEVGLRTLGSVFLVINYKTIGQGFSKLMKGNIKEAWDVAKTKDNFTRTAGYGMVAGKAMGLLSETYDPNNPPKTYWQEIRQKVLWPVSSFTEMVSQSSFVYDKAKNKKIVLGNKLQSDYVGSAGNVLLTVPPYPARLVLPYGQKNLDVDEVHARLLDELHKLPEDKIPEVAARVTSRMVEHMRGNAPDFSVLYRKLMSKLDKYHDIDVLPHGVDPMAGAKDAAGMAAKPSDAMASFSEKPQSQPEKKFTDKIKTKTADDLVKDMSMVGKVSNADISENVMAR